MKVTAEHLTRMSDKVARYERTVLMMSQLLIARDMICFVQFTWQRSITPACERERERAIYGHGGLLNLRET